MKYRNEVKYIITKNQAKILMEKLNLIMDLDTNTKDNSYIIKSLYFDNINQDSYYEKLDGILYRKKYRIRLYNKDSNFIRLECKYKHNNMTSKEQALINKDICDKITKGNYDIDTKDDTLNKFLCDMKVRHLIPSVIVEYERVAYTYPVSTVRITFDFNIKSGIYNYNLFDSNSLLTSVLDHNLVVLEVKFDNVLPIHIANILETIPSYRQAVSKFALCRELK